MFLKAYHFSAPFIGISSVTCALLSNLSTRPHFHFRVVLAFSTQLEWLLLRSPKTHTSCNSVVSSQSSSCPTYLQVASRNQTLYLPLTSLVSPFYSLLWAPPPHLPNPEHWSGPALDSTTLVFISPQSFGIFSSLMP